MMTKLLVFFSFVLLSTAYARAEVSVHSFEVSNADVKNGFVVERIWLKNFEMPSIKMSKPLLIEAIGLTKQNVATSFEQMESALGMDRKRPFVFVKIPVFIKSTNGVQQLQSFSLEIKESDQPTKVALKTTTTAQSVLATGTWYKISVKDRGLYKIDYDFLKNKLGIDPTNIDTRNIRLYGNGGTMLYEDNAVPYPDDLVENAIEVHDGGDNKFDQNDFVNFYANGPLEWAIDTIQHTFRHRSNLYEDKSYYFISFDNGVGKRIQSEASLTSSNVSVGTFDDYQVYEKDLVNLGKFGKKWWGEDFGVDGGKQSTRTFSFNTMNNDTALFRISIGSKSQANNNSFNIAINGSTIANATIYGAANNDIAVVSYYGEFRAPTIGGVANVQLTYLPGESTARGYLDYIEVINRRPIALINGLTVFRDWNSVANGNMAAFTVQNANGNTNVWDITNPLIPIRINGNLQGSVYNFNRDASQLHQYVAFDGSNFSKPEFVQKVVNQNLHGTGVSDLIIVTYPDFVNGANKLADFHRQHDAMRVTVATTDQVNNEFASGSNDIGAIRNFVKMLYKNAGSDTTKMPRHLLLLGDASYDYKNRVPNNSNYVPTYETAESDDAINGYCSDDFFAFLDDFENIEGIQPNSNLAIVNTMDISVGRLPVSSADAANKIADKIIKYASAESLGPWRLSTTIMADNGDDNIHFDDGEAMAGTISGKSDLYNDTKVYISALPTVSTPGGVRCPDANKLINDQVFKGTFLMNYNGHGSPTTLSAKRILTQDDFNSWKNDTKLPIMVTATCTFSKYDDPALTSAGELLVVKPDGGAIALLTTTQLVYQFLNHQLNVNFLATFFQKNNSSWLTFGDAFRMSKNATYISPQMDVFTRNNYRKFALLGDPALMPSFPRYNVTTDSIMNGYSETKTDTIKALGKYSISGSVKDDNGNVMSTFNGRAYITIYDKPGIASTLTGPPRNFQIQNSIIYKGKATITNGRFAFSFIAPKDLNYDFGKGKISYYAENGITDAAGADTNTNVGGFSDVVVADTDGPLVQPFINDSLFKDGGITGSNTTLFVKLFDQSGINVSGNGIGHNLTAVLDGDVANPYVLNDYYETSPNDYQHGFVNFPITGLSEGKHSLVVKAWDMFNNSGEGTVNFVVINGQIVQINNLMSYPNPFHDKTHFVFEHNHPGEELKVQINIFSTSGYLVRTLEDVFTPSGSRSNEIIWDGTSNNGAQAPAGLYVYKLSITTIQGIQATAYQKLVLIR